jgi:NTP pyrophosphatase (non-canonical NTP hydrolase)
MTQFEDITIKINKWVSVRGWEKHQKPKDLAISLCLEAAEVLEHFQWKNDSAVKKHVAKNRNEIADELADVGIYLFKLADKIGVDLAGVMEKKLIKQAKKYPVKSRVPLGLEEYSRIKKEYRRKK